MSEKETYEVPILLTPRLKLRPLLMSDAPSIFAIFSDPKTLEYWGHDVISELPQAEALIRSNLDSVEGGSCIYWAIEERTLTCVIGTCTLFKIDKQNRHAEVGYILHRDFWGKGLMSEALLAIIAYAFNTLQMHRLEADVDPQNKASLTLLKKFGFKHEGLFRERWFVHGKWLDSDMLGLLKSEYSLGKL